MGEPYLWRLYMASDLQERHEEYYIADWLKTLLGTRVYSAWSPIMQLQERQEVYLRLYHWRLYGTGVCIATEKAGDIQHWWFMWDFTVTEKVDEILHSSRLTGFDTPFIMGSAKCKIEWNDNFDVTYLELYGLATWTFEHEFKKYFSRHAKRWYSHENIVSLSVALTWHLSTCILAKKRMPN